MPVWTIRCETCGHDTSALVKLATRERAGGLVPCARCGDLTKPRPTAARIKDAGFRPINSGDMIFRSAQEIDAFCEEHGKVPVFKGSQEYLDLKAEARKGAEESARNFGYTNLEEKRRKWAGDEKTYLNDIRNVKIREYHDKYGSADRLPVEKAFDPE